MGVTWPPAKGCCRSQRLEETEESVPRTREASRAAVRFAQHSGLGFGFWTWEDILLLSGATKPAAPVAAPRNP